MSTRKKLVQTAKRLAELPFHGRTEEQESNLLPIVRLFPKWDLERAERMWCAAFVYYCCVQAGFQIPYSPKGCRTCSLAGCGGWEEFALSDSRIEYHLRESGFEPQAGDIVLYDRVFINREHDHIGIVLENHPGFLITAEGNVGNSNASSIAVREKDSHIRAFIRLPDNYRYK